MESVTICAATPGVTEFDGVKVASAPRGSGVAGEMLNVTGFGNSPFEGASVNAKLAVFPAVTGGGEASGISE